MPEPVFVALLLADRVITEDNQKKAIIGTFTQFTVRQVRRRLPPWFIYAAVTNLAGEHPFSLNLVLDKSQQVIFSAGGTLSVDDPRRVVELVIPVPNVFSRRRAHMSFHFMSAGSRSGRASSTWCRGAAAPRRPATAR